MNRDPHRPSLSDRLKELQSAEAPLGGPAFGAADVIRGGRRRRRRRTVARSLGAIAAVAALGAGAVLPQVRGGNAEPLPPAVATAASPSAPALPAVNLTDDQSVVYKQVGATVTATRKDGPVATLTLMSADYTDDSGHVVFSLTAARAVTLDTGLFTLYSEDGGENSLEKPAVLRFAAGVHTLVLDWKQTGGVPAAVGWPPANGSAVWPRAK